MASPRILIVLTSHNELGNTGELTGFWLEEFSAPYYTFLDGGAVITLASIKGGQPPIDPKSYHEDWQTDATRRFLSDTSAQTSLENTIPISEVDSGDHDAIFLPGGHGPMWDFPTNSTLAHLIEAFNKEEKVISAVCHASVALVSVKAASGEPLVKGKVVTGFTNSEEKAVGLEAVVPFLLETRLRELGANFAKGEDWQPNIQQDANIITGQNPASSEPAARAVLAVLAD